MAKFCTQCGTELDATAKFCIKCGTAVGQTGQPEGASRPGDPPDAYRDPSWSSNTPSGGGLQPNLAGLLCYVLGLVTGILFLVIAPYKNDPFVRFHAYQSIIGHVVWVGLWIVRGVVSSILPWPLQFIASLFYRVVALGGLLVWLFLMYKAYNKEKFKLPVIGDIALRQAG